MNRIQASAIVAAMLVGVTVGCTHPGPGMGGMGGMGGRGMQMGPDTTPGWGMMSPQERDEHHRKMMGSKSEAECNANREQHHREMVDRAKARGQTVDGPRHDPCAMMKQQGMFKP